MPHIFCKNHLKGILLIISTIIADSCIGQDTRSNLSRSIISVCGTKSEGKNIYTAIEVETKLTDTTLDDIEYTKFQIEHFTDYSKARQIIIRYESFTNTDYVLLDKDLKTVHKINYSTTKAQTGRLFGIIDTIKMEFIDNNSRSPFDTLIPTKRTPRKYYLQSKPELSVIIIPDLRTLAVTNNGTSYITRLLGDIYNQISNGIKNNYSATNSVSIHPGDELQVFYRRKWYNDTTGLAEYEDKQFMNFNYLSDSTIEKEKAMKFKIDGYNYLSGSKQNPEFFFTTVTDSGYYYSGSQFIRYRNYGNELAVLGDTADNSFFLQGVDYDSIGNGTYPKIVQYYSNAPYRFYILPEFPLLMVEFGNVQGRIVYSKIGGKIKGSMRTRTYITDKTNLRDIHYQSEREVIVEMFLKEASDLTIDIQNAKNIHSNFRTHQAAGLHFIRVKTFKMNYNENYQIEISYKDQHGSGAVSTTFRANN